MKSNFEFLLEKWGELYQVAKSAEKNMLADPNATLIKLRLFGELVTKYVMTFEGIKEPYRMNQKEKVDTLLKEGTITLEVHQLLDSLRTKGNKAVHETYYGSTTEAKSMLMAAFYLGAWLHQLYGQWDFELPPYNEPDTLKITPMIDEKALDLNTYKKQSSITAGHVITFINQEVDYEKWLQENQSGYVFNHFGGKEASKDMNKIHIASCRFLHRVQDVGKRTTVYPKICSNTLQDLEAHVVELRGQSWVYCKSCNI